MKTIEEIREKLRSRSLGEEPWDLDERPGMDRGLPRRLPRGKPVLPGDAGALYNAEEAAAYWSVSPETVLRLVRAKLLTHVSVTPSEYRFTLEDLREYIEARRHKRFKGV
jgi:excisionase family DNA binding protein